MVGVARKGQGWADLAFKIGLSYRKGYTHGIQIGRPFEMVQ
jgi:hypothetical protein